MTDDQNWYDWRSVELEDSDADIERRIGKHSNDGDGFPDWTTWRPVQVQVDDAVCLYYVRGEHTDGPYIAIETMARDHTHLREEVQAALVNAVSLSTQPLVTWQED